MKSADSSRPWDNPDFSNQSQYREFHIALIRHSYRSLQKLVSICITAILDNLKSAWSLASIERFHLLWLDQKSVRKWEAQVWLKQLLNIWTTNIFRLDFSNLDDVNSVETSTMLSSQILVASDNSIRASQFTIFLVHVVGSRARVISDPETKILDLRRLLFKDLGISE
jgi:hypothetical protein